MPKAAAVYPSANKYTNNDDAALLAMAQRHDALWTEWEGLGDKDPRLDGVCHEACELERVIAATPAFTAAGHLARRRVLERAEFDDGDGILTLTLENEAKRIGVSGS